MGFASNRKGLQRDIRQREAVIQKIGNATDDASVRERSLAVWNVAEDLFRLNRFAEAADRFEEAALTLSRFDSLAGVAVQARVRQAMALMALQRSEAALEVLRELLGRVGIDGKVPEQPELISSALVFWLSLLERLGHLEEADAASEAVIEELSPGETQRQRDRVAALFLTQGRVRQMRGDTAGALTAFDEAIRRCEGEDDAAFLTTITEAQLRRAALLEDADRTRDAVQAVDEGLAHFASAPHRSLQELVAEAKARKTRLALRETDGNLGS